jgi:PAS domain S-box-containing protein
VAFLLVLGLQEGYRRAAGGPARGERLGEALAGEASAWIQGRREATRLVAGPLQQALLAGASPDATRDPLVRLRRAYPEVLRAAALVDGQGSIVLAAEAWREGSSPAWARGAPAEGVAWNPGATAGSLLVREGLVAPPALRPPVSLITSWDLGGVRPGWERILADQEDARAVLLSPEGTRILQVPAAGPGPSPALSATRPIPAAALQVRLELPGPPGGLLWPAGLALAVGGVGGLIGGSSEAKRRREDRRLGERLRLAAQGKPTAGDDSKPAMPETERALDELRRRGEERQAGRAAVESLTARLRGGAVLVTDATARLELVAGDGRAVLGVPEEEMRGIALRRLLTPASWESLAPMLARASLQGEGATLEVELSREGQEGRVVELTLAGRGGRGGYVLLARDAGRDRKLREDLARTRERFRALAEGMRDGLITVRDGNIESANPAFAALLGLGVEELVGTPLKRHVAPSDVLVLAERLRGGGEDGAPFDLRLVRADSMHPVETRASLTRREDGTVLLVVRDEGERRRFERLLTDAHRRLDATLDAASDAIVALEPRGGERRVVFANRALADLLDRSRHEVEGWREDEIVQALVTRGLLPEAFRSLTASIRDLPGARRSERFESPSEPRRTFEVHAAPLDPSGAGGRVIAVRDVTAQANAESRLRRDHEVMQARREILEQANRELERVNRDLEGRTAELHRVNRGLRQLDEMRSNLLANVSHELQTPLVSIRGYTEMILKGKIGPVTDEQRRGLEISLKNIDRLIGLIDNLLEFSRTEGGLMELKLASFPLKPLISEILLLMGDVADRASVRLEADYPGGDPVIRADREGVGQVLLNLVSNGIKFNRPGGEVRVEVQPSRRGFARVAVRDTGRGIPPEDLERIFDRYYRVKSEPGRQVEGSGLGLAIVRQILQVHGCTIRAEAPAEGGSLFTFTLPLAREGDGTAPPTVERRRSVSARDE